MTSMEEQLDTKIDEIVLRCFMQGQYYGTASGVINGEESGELNPDYEPDNPIDRDQAVKAIKALLSQHTQRARVENEQESIKRFIDAIFKEAKPIDQCYLAVRSFADKYIAQLSTKDSTNKEEA